MEAFKGLEDFSHIWIIFVFHSGMRDNWKATVRPPGWAEPPAGFFQPVPASANPSACRQSDSRRLSGKRKKHIFTSAALTDGWHPVLDIKPYLPYADAISDASGGFASSIRKLLYGSISVRKPEPFVLKKNGPDTRVDALTEQLLIMDPRPPIMHPRSKSHFGMKVYDFNVLWEILEGAAYVTAFEEGNESQTT